MGALEKILDELLIAYATEAISHQGTQDIDKRRERLRRQFIRALLRASGVVVKD